MYKTIIVPIDIANAERGRSMIARARLLGGDGAKIILLSVLESIPGYIRAEMPSDIEGARLDQAKRELDGYASAAGGNISAEVRSGKPASEIIHAAEVHGADLIIVASHNPGMQDYFLGSTAARVVRHAQCSVLVDR